MLALACLTCLLATTTAEESINGHIHCVVPVGHVTQGGEVLTVPPPDVGLDKNRPTLGREHDLDVCRAVAHGHCVEYILGVLLYEYCSI